MARILTLLIVHDLALIVNTIGVDRPLALSWNVPIWAFAFRTDFWFIARNPHMAASFTLASLKFRF
jgi:hypothetical protein